MSAYGMHECCNLLSDGAEKKKLPVAHAPHENSQLHSGLWTLGSGLETLDSGVWILHSELWTVDSGL